MVPLNYRHNLQWVRKLPINVKPTKKYKKMRDEKEAQKIFQQDLLDDAFKPKNDMLTVPTKNIPSVQDVIGRTLPMIGKYSDLGLSWKLLN